MSEYIEEYDDEYLERIGYLSEPSENQNHQLFNGSFEYITINGNNVSPYLNGQAQHYDEDGITLIQWDGRSSNDLPFRHYRYRYRGVDFTRMSEAEQYKRWYESTDPDDIAKLYDNDIDSERANILFEYVRSMLIDSIISRNRVSSVGDYDFIINFLSMAKSNGYITDFIVEPSNTEPYICIRLRRGNHTLSFSFDYDFLQRY